MIEVIEMIYEAYVKESKITDKTDEEKSLDLVKSLIKTKYELDSACKNFEYSFPECYLLLNLSFLFSLINN